MFEDSLMESGGKTQDEARRNHRALVCSRDHFCWRPGVTPADLHRSAAEAAIDDLPGCTATATATAATTGGRSRGAEEDPNRTG